MRRLASALVSAAIFACCLGCGYTTGGSFPEQYATVAVPIFENRTFYETEGLSRELTEAIVKHVEQRTPYTTARGGRADTELSGVITSVDQRLLSRNPDTGLPEQLEVTVTIDWQWKDQRTGETIVDRRGFSAVGRYLPATPIGEPYEAAQHAAVDKLARDIVSAMRGDW